MPEQCMRCEGRVGHGLADEDVEIDQFCQDLGRCPTCRAVGVFYDSQTYHQVNVEPERAIIQALFALSRDIEGMNRREGTADE